VNAKYDLAFTSHSLLGVRSKALVEDRASEEARRAVLVPAWLLKLLGLGGPGLRYLFRVALVVQRSSPPGRFI